MLKHKEQIILPYSTILSFMIYVEPHNNLDNKHKQTFEMNKKAPISQSTILKKYVDSGCKRRREEMRNRKINQNV